MLSTCPHVHVFEFSCSPVIDAILCNVDVGAASQNKTCSKFVGGPPLSKSKRQAGYPVTDLEDLAAEGPSSTAKDSFFRSAPKGSLGLYRTYERALDGGDCPQCDLSKDFDALKKRCDVYDNAVAAIYLTKRGQVEAAQEILDVFLRLMYPTDFTNIYPEELYLGRVFGEPFFLAENAENGHFLEKDYMKMKAGIFFFCNLGFFMFHEASTFPAGFFQRFRYRGLPSGRTLTLLAAAYECDTVVKAGTYDEPQVMDGAVDSGNNAWVPWTRLGRKGWAHG